MYRRQVIPICLACLIGTIQTMTTVEDECGINFLKNLRGANFNGQLENGTLRATFNVKYLSKEGGSRTAVIKLGDHCSAPKIICEGEKIEFNGEAREGPLLYCSWKWKPEDSVRNEVEIGLTDEVERRRAVYVIGRLSKEEEVFPDAANNGPLDFKIITANGSGLLRRKRSETKRKARTVNVDRKRRKKARRSD